MSCRSPVLASVLSTAAAAFVLIGPSTAQAAPADPAAAMTAAAPNGCGGEGWTSGVPDSFGDADFTPACNAHDVCYEPASTTNRLDCDNKLRDDLHAACFAAYGAPEPDPPGPRGPSGPAGTCHHRADLYYDGVRTFGKSFYQAQGDPA